MASDKPTRRRTYSEALKAQVLAECEAPGASVCKVALGRGINANVVHRWRQLLRGGKSSVPAVSSGFVPVSLATTPAAPDGIASPDIQVDLRRHRHEDHLADICGGRVRRLDPRVAALIRIESLWVAIKPLDMRAGTESALGRVVKVFGAAHSHTAYLFANRRANRMKVLGHDGVGIWLAARRLHRGKFIWPHHVEGTLSLSRVQLDALVLGLPLQMMGEAGIIRVL